MIADVFTSIDVATLCVAKTYCITTRELLKIPKMVDFVFLSFRTLRLLCVLRGLKKDLTAKYAKSCAKYAKE